MATDRTAAFAILLRQHRLEAGLTQAALAERAALSVRAVQNLEAGLGQPQRETARRLAEALALTADQSEEFARAATPAPRSRPPGRIGVARAAGPDGLRGVATTERFPSTGDLAGARKQVTVLSACIAGVTDSDLDSGPDGADYLLDEILGLLVEAAHLYGGTVTRADGDGLTVLFGAPLGNEDHAICACRAALAMQHVVRRHAEQVAGERAAGLALGLGLSSGEVVVRVVSNDLSSDYAAVGPAARVSARLGQIAGSGVTLATWETLRLVEGHVQTRPLGPVEVHGLTDRVEVFELTTVESPRSRFRVATSRQLTSFVGRDAELASLSLPLLRARSGHGQVVAVVGEPGVGKSRLIYELARSPALDGWTILEGGGVSYGKETPYLPLVGLFRTYFGITVGDAVHQIQQKAATRILALDEGLASELPAVLSLLDVAIDDPAWQALEPRERRKRIHDAFRRLLLRESCRRPLLMMIEDLHWVDGETRALLDSVVGSLPGARMLMLVTYRPENPPVWSSSTHYTQLRIDPLTPESSAELLQALLGDDPELKPLAPLLIERADGSPFFLEESVRTLVETGALVGDRGAYRLAKALPSVRVPATVQAVLAARIDRLAPEDRRLLQIAAAIGKDVPSSLLRAVGDLEEDALHDCLSRLRGAELIYEANPFPEPLYSFKHALTHEVAYGSLLRERQRALHGRILEAIEVIHADHLDEQAETLAHHAIRAERWDLAVRYARLAGARAVARSAYREAVAWLERARVAAEHLPAGSETIEHAIDIRLDLRHMLNPLGENRRALEYLREAEVLAEQLGDRPRLASVLSMLSNLHYHLGESDRGVEVGERALALAEALGDERLRVPASFHFASPCRESGDPLRPIEHLLHTIAFLDNDTWNERFGLAAYPAASCRGVLAICLSDLGRFEEATIWGYEAIQIADRFDHPYTQALVRTWVGGAETERGRVGEAAGLLERAVTICESWDLRTVLPMAASRLGRAYALGGRADEGATLLLRAAEQDERGGGICESACRAAWIGEAYLMTGRIDDAARFSRWSRDRAIAGGERRNVAWALRLLGQIATHRQSPKVDEAERHTLQALTLAENLGLRPLQAHCRLNLGKLYRVLGRREQARAELSTAIGMFQEMGMTFWIPEAEAELAEAR